MKKLLPLPLLFLVLACGDHTILQPADTASPDFVVTAEPTTPAHGGWEFTADATYLGSPSLGDTYITPGNVMHWTDFENEFQLSGDLAGTWTWSGDTHVVLRTGKGPAAGSFLFDLTSPGAGTFECRGNGMLLDYPAGLFSITGKIFSCDGTGYFEGKSLKATWFNTPGTIDYHLSGVIW